MCNGIRRQLAGGIPTTREIDGVQSRPGLFLQEMESRCELGELVGFDVVGHSFTT